MVEDWVRRSRSSWSNRGGRRPDFAVEPAPGQESVWDYPRPPALVSERRLVTVTSAFGPVASSVGAVRVLETASPPTVYLPPEDIDFLMLEEVDGSSHCEWKGEAQYWGLAAGGPAVGWSYPDPYLEYQQVTGWLSFYPARIECRLENEVVRPQPGGFYGGWLTDEIVGPVKGEPGSQSW